MPCSEFANRLRDLARRPFVLLAWMLAANALACPYLGFHHDARLYSGQVLNRLEPETLSGDLFFQFGSQDRYSIFSPIMAPLVRLVGFDLGFFAYYLIAMPLFFYALQRLALRLVPASPGAIVGLLYAAMVPLPYGGHNIFHVVESFTTPRLLASALTLLALTLSLEGRAIRAAAVFLMAFAFHPLMTLPGVVLAIAYLVWTRFGGRLLLTFAIVAGLALVAVLAIPMIGERLLGTMDGEWKNVVRLTCLYQFPDAWRLQDWSIACLVLTTGAVAAYRLCQQAGAARFLILATTLGALGLIAAVIIMRLSYALPIMVQPYRSMWIVTALMPPLIFSLAWRLWESQRLSQRSLALLPLLFLGLTDSWTLEISILILMLPLAFIAVRILGRRLSIGDRIVATLATSLLGGFTVWGMFRLIGFLQLHRDWLFRFDPMVDYQLLHALVGPGLLMLAMAFAMWLTRSHLVRAGTAGSLATLALAWQTAVFLAPRVSPSDAVIDPYRPGIRFVANFLDSHDRSHPIHVYSNLRRSDIVWLDWHARSYFDMNNTAGFIFARATALEGNRRVPLAGPFEVDYIRHRQEFATEEGLEGSQEFFQCDLKEPLRPDHLFRLAEDAVLDYVILWDLDQPELLKYASAIGPRVAIFDAHELRLHDAEQIASETAERDQKNRQSQL
jgi:hypothetical protein